MDMTASQLKKLGYRVVSRRHRLVSRIDRHDWKDLHVNSDFYRRCISKDVLKVPASYLPKIPNSGNSDVGYIESPLDVTKKELDK